MNLKQGTLLQSGKYRIERELGHGGFGITYLATQVALNRRVAIKEFFMREYCNRDADTSHVSVPSAGSKELVTKFRNKFVKEAQNIACLKHPHIISIYDVFEENATAYYVMEYHEHKSLSDMVKSQGRLAESDALRYIRQISDALRYIHARKMNHLDVKPSNILIDEAGHAILIDFGLSKRYDNEGNQTSTTPVGISHGYAPLEQYKKNGVGVFSPVTDIYSLGATLYKLVTGNTPPEADVIIEEGMPSFPSYISPGVASAIRYAMQPLRKNRPQSVEVFLASLEDEPTSLDEQSLEIIVENVEDDNHSLPLVVLEEKVVTKHSSASILPSTSMSKPAFNLSFLKHWWILAVSCLVLILVIGVISAFRQKRNNRNISDKQDTTMVVVQPGDSTNAIGQNLESQALKHQATPVKEEITTLALSTLSVNTTPTGATVYIDGKPVGRTPIVDLQIDNGSRVIKLAKEGYKAKTIVHTFDGKATKLEEVLLEIVKPVPTPAGNRKSYTVNGVSFVMVNIAGGTFIMGSPDSDTQAYSDEKPAHEVKLSSYSLGETEVTQELWMAVMGSNPSYFIGDVKRPVENVSWKDCKKFIQKLNSLTGAKFRLPTEAEWEYAACGGDSKNKYSSEKEFTATVWYASNSKKTTHTVKSKSPNRFGLYDMGGNVKEWCSDWKEDYPSVARTNPRGPSLGVDRVVRGGAWNSSAGACRVTHRNGNSPDYGLNSIGLRLAL